MKAQVVRELSAKAFMEGPELCREYFRDGRIWFGTSTVPVGATGAVDAGHAESVEIFFCAWGEALVDLGDVSHELRAGDALVIPPTVPHTISNVGTEPVVIVWAGAPGD
jgi:mannose-6-phosphate isomerase-like protein (cupin superfamily)